MNAGKSRAVLRSAEMQEATGRRQIRLAGVPLGRARHICALFHDRDEEYEVVLPFIQEGLREGDRAFYIIDGRRRDEHLARLKQGGIDVEAAGRAGRFEVKGWGGRFDQEAMLTLIQEILDQGKLQGCPLTRLIANMEWALEDHAGAHDLVEFEARLNYILPSYDDPVTCTYDASRFGGHLIVDILRTHPVVLVAGVLQENPFYVGPDEFLRELRARHRVAAGRRSANDAQDGDALRGEVRHLRSSLSALVALSGLSAVEAGREPAVMAETLADALLAITPHDLVFVRTHCPPHWSDVEFLRLAEGMTGGDEAHRLLSTLVKAELGGSSRVVRARLGPDAVSLVVVALGPRARYGWLVAGSRRAGFPDEVERAVVELGAHQLAAGLRERHLAERRRAEAALRDSEERFRSAFAHAAVGMVLATLDGRFVQVNKAACEIVGRDEAEMLATDLRSITHPDDLPHLMEAVEQLLASGAAGTVIEKRCLRKDGTTVTVQASLSLTRDAEGKPRYLVILEQDITDRRRAEEALRLSEARFSKLFRNNPGALGIGTIREGRMIDANDHWLKLFGYRRDEVIGRTVFDLSLWVDPRERSGAIGRLSSEGVVRDMEVRFRRKSGEIRDALLSFVRVDVPGEKEPVTLSMVVDVTERRRAEIERGRLDSITDAALANLGLDALLAELLGRLRIALRADVVAVRLVDETAQLLVLRAVVGVPFECIAEVRGPVESSETIPLTLDAPYVDNDLQPPPAGSDDWYARIWRALGLPLRAGMWAPLVVEGKPIGVLYAVSTRTPFTQEDQRLLRVVADRVAPAIERGRLVETVRASSQRLAALSHRLVDIQEAERRAVARELHDEVGQLLTGLRLMIESSEASGGQKAEMTGIVTDLIGSVRGLSMNLRPPMLDDLGLLPALLWQIERFETQTSIRVDFHHANLDRRFTSQLEITAFRIVQEALTNVARHAGVTRVKVEVWADAESLGVRIADEGRGFDVGAGHAARSSGLEGMRERSRLAGGRLVIESEPGRGTLLELELPLGQVRPDRSGD